ANIGNHSVYFGKFLARHVVAVEPNPQLAPILRRNLLVNGVTNSSAFGCAIGAGRGDCVVVLPEEHRRNVGATRVVGRAAEAETPAAAVVGTVAMITLDDLPALLDPELAEEPIRLVKIDVEGAELDVLRGGLDVLRRQQPHLVVELSEPQTRAAVE